MSQPIPPAVEASLARIADVLEWARATKEDEDAKAEANEGAWVEADPSPPPSFDPFEAVRDVLASFARDSDERADRRNRDADERHEQRVHEAEAREETRLHDLVRRIERVEEEVGLSHAAPYRVVSHQNALDFLEDLAKHGTGFDVVPTLSCPKDRVVDELHDYIGQIDKSIRKRAQALLKES